jgi:excisionase family DNA binding protein
MRRMDFMTLVEMAESLGLKDTAPLRRLCEAGKLAAIKKGRDWFVPIAEVERYRSERLGKRGRPVSGKGDAK